MEDQNRPLFDFNLWKVYRPTRPMGNWLLVFRDGHLEFPHNRPNPRLLRDGADLALKAKIAKTLKIRPSEVE
jgi:hypothetical protein